MLSSRIIDVLVKINDVSIMDDEQKGKTQTNVTLEVYKIANSIVRMCKNDAW